MAETAYVTDGLVRHRSSRIRVVVRALILYVAATQLVVIVTGTTASGNGVPAWYRVIAVAWGLLLLDDNRRSIVWVSSKDGAVVEFSGLGWRRRIEEGDTWCWSLASGIFSELGRRGTAYDLRVTRAGAHKSRRFRAGVLTDAESLEQARHSCNPDPSFWGGFDIG